MSPVRTLTAAGRSPRHLEHACKSRVQQGHSAQPLLRNMDHIIVHTSGWVHMRGSPWCCAAPHPLRYACTACWPP